jgi:predicted ester cyclase
MSTESNKSISRRFWEEVFGMEKLELADELIAPGFSDTGPGATPGLPSGPEGSKMLVKIYRTAFPDLQFTVDEQVAEGDKVMTRWSAKGTHRGDLAGIPPTGKSVSVTGISIDRIAGGKIVETWGIFDQFGMLQQLGVIPAQG